jgi:hypothetical protein
MTESLKDVLDNKKTKGILNSYSNSREVKKERASPVEARKIAEMLDDRVRNDAFIPFYCKAIIRLGQSKVQLAQSMALDPSVKNSERMFSWLLKKELEAAA